MWSKIHTIGMLDIFEFTIVPTDPTYLEIELYQPPDLSVPTQEEVIFAGTRQTTVDEIANTFTAQYRQGMKPAQNWHYTSTKCIGRGFTPNEISGIHADALRISNEQTKFLLNAEIEGIWNAMAPYEKAYVNYTLFTQGNWITLWNSIRHGIVPFPHYWKELAHYYMHVYQMEYECLYVKDPEPTNSPNSTGWLTQMVGTFLFKAAATILVVTCMAAMVLPKSDLNREEFGINDLMLIELDNGTRVRASQIDEASVTLLNQSPNSLFSELGTMALGPLAFSSMGSYSVHARHLRIFEQKRTNGMQSRLATLWKRLMSFQVVGLMSQSCGKICTMYGSLGGLLKSFPLVNGFIDQVGIQKRSVMIILKHVAKLIPIPCLLTTILTLFISVSLAVKIYPMIREQSLVSKIVLTVFLALLSLALASTFLTPGINVILSTTRVGLLLKTFLTGFSNNVIAFIPPLMKSSRFYLTRAGKMLMFQLFPLIGKSIVTSMSACLAGSVEHSGNWLRKQKELLGAALSGRVTVEERLDALTHLPVILI
jgi:hypothetical protein